MGKALIAQGEHESLEAIGTLTMTCNVRGTVHINEFELERSTRLV